MISLERSGEIIEWMGLKNACAMLLSLSSGSDLSIRSYYERHFEELFLRESAQYYRAASQKFLAENSAPVYVRKARNIPRLALTTLSCPS